MPRRRGRTPVPDWEREFNRRLGRNIAAARRASGLTGCELARRLKVWLPQLWHWEHGRFGIGVAGLQLIANALGVTSTSLIPPIDDFVIDAEPPIPLPWTRPDGETRLLHHTALEGAPARRISA
jgi:transcriptional regulator with XRE-family HTH domain